MATQVPLLLNHASNQKEELQTADALNIGYPVHGFKNAVINGAMEITQRGSSFNAATNVITLDRWRYTTDGTVGAGTISQQALTRGDTTFFPTILKNFLRVNKTAAGSGQSFQRLQQRIENADTLSNASVVLSFWAKADTNRTITVTLIQDFGTGGGPSTAVTLTAQNVSLTGSWQRFTHNFTLPSVSGKTFGSDANSFVAIRFELPINTTYTIDLTAVQLEQSQTATDFEIRPIAIEQFLCGRYCRVMSSEALGEAVTSSVFRAAPVFFPGMRTTPTVSLSTTTPTLTIFGISTFAGTASTATIQGAANSRVGHTNVDGFTGLTTGIMAALTVGVLTFDAEL